MHLQSLFRGLKPLIFLVLTPCLFAQSPPTQSPPAIPPELQESLKKAGLTFEEAERIAAEQREKRKKEAAAKQAEKTPTVPVEKRAAIQIAPSAVANYPWPGSSRVLPLEAEIRTEQNDGMWETLLFLSGDGLRFNFHIPDELSIARDSGEASARLVNRLLPDDRLDLFLFPPGSFVPDVNETTLRGYQLALKKKNGETVSIDEDSDLIPSGTFSVFGEQWGVVRYRLGEEAEALNFVEFFIPISGRLLVLRVQGTDSFVKWLEPRIVSSMSTLTLEN